MNLSAGAKQEFDALAALVFGNRRPEQSAALSGTVFTLFVMLELYRVVAGSGTEGCKQRMAEVEHTSPKPPLRFDAAYPTTADTATRVERQQRSRRNSFKHQLSTLYILY